MLVFKDTPKPLGTATYLLFEFSVFFLEGGDVLLEGLEFFLSLYAEAERAHSVLKKSI